MIDQLIIGNKNSFYDFEASISEREIKSPSKKSIKETLPFSNETYDFTAINGEAYWNERELIYTFEIIADNPELLEEKNRKFLSWIMNTQNKKICDPFIKNYHFVGTFENMELEYDESMEKVTIIVTFLAYPYMIANQMSKRNVKVTEEETEVVVVNNSGHRINPQIVATVPLVINTSDSQSYAFNAGTHEVDNLFLNVGANAFTVKSTDGTGTLTFNFYEEVF